MWKKGLILGFLLLGLGLVVQPTQAENIHLRYFEAADVLLTDSQYQLFTVSALEDELVTIVAYGLDEGVTPSIALFDRDGRTMLEDRNLDGLPAASLQAVIPANCIYTFLVSRTSATGGRVRVMVFSGEPLSEDLSMLDTVDPFLPNRAFFLAGDSSNPIEVSLEVLDGAGIYASRGTQLAPPPVEERTTARSSIRWENDNGEVFYTLHVSFYPEALPTSQKLGAQLSRMSQTLGTSTVRLNVNRGSTEADYLARPICDALVTIATPWLAGPGGQYKALSDAPLPIGTELELVGEFGDYYQVVNVENPIGDAWVLKAAVEKSSTADCSRVQEVFAPPLNDQNRSGM